MRYAGLKLNDIANCDSGICVSYWSQGCPLHCKGCHNPQTWDPDDGLETTKEEIICKILEAIPANGIQRNFSILGGEPLAPYNIDFTRELISIVRAQFPNIKIYLWTGYEFEHIKNLIDGVDVIICGPFIQEQRDITLPLRGSKNQRVLRKGIDF